MFRREDANVDEGNHNENCILVITATEHLAEM